MTELEQLLADLVAIESVNPALDAAGSGERTRTMSGWSSRPCSRFATCWSRRAERFFCSTICATLVPMPSRIVRARLDEESRLALSVLMNQGRTESEAIRTALIEAAERRRQPEALAEEARRLAADPRDRAEAQAILADFEAIDPDWPE